MTDLSSLTADIAVEHHGTVAMLVGQTAAGRQWLQDHVSSEPWQWMGGGLAAEPRMVQDVIDGAQADGLRVAV